MKDYRRVRFTSHDSLLLLSVGDEVFEVALVALQHLHFLLDEHGSVLRTEQQKNTVHLYECMRMECAQRSRSAAHRSLASAMRRCESASWRSSVSTRSACSLRSFCARLADSFASRTAASRSRICSSSACERRRDSLQMQWRNDGKRVLHNLVI